MGQAARQARENNETILVIVTTIFQILAGMAGFQENPLSTSLQEILYSLSPRKKSPTSCTRPSQCPLSTDSIAKRWLLTPSRPVFKFLCFLLYWTSRMREDDIEIHAILFLSLNHCLYDVIFLLLLFVQSQLQCKARNTRCFINIVLSINFS